MFARGLLAACIAFAGVALGSIPALTAPEVLAFSAAYHPGTIIVRTGARTLYLVLEGAAPVRYKVGVGKSGMQWAGVSQIDGNYSYPAWSPPTDRLRGRAPYVIPGDAPQ